MIFDAEGRTLLCDSEGYLVDPEAWDECAAQQLARIEGLELQLEHWQVIDFMRRYYDEHWIAADARHVIAYMALEMGQGRRARNRLFELFPYGYVQQACKIAGMKRPRGWSTG